MDARPDVLQSSGVALRVSIVIGARIRVGVLDRDAVMRNPNRVTRASLVPVKCIVERYRQCTEFGIQVDLGRDLHFAGHSPSRGQLASVAAASQTAAFPLAEAIADYPLECESEVLAEESVNARIYRGIAVTEPEQNAEDRRMDAVRAKRTDEVHREERQPAEYEAADDDAQSLGRFCLHSKSLHLQFHRDEA